MWRKTETGYVGVTTHNDKCKLVKRDGKWIAYRDSMFALVHLGDFKLLETAKRTIGYGPYIHGTW